MKSNTGTMFAVIAGLLFVVILIVILYQWTKYDMGLYHRKYPGTTPLDYWMDGGHGK